MAGRLERRHNHGRHTHPPRVGAIRYEGNPKFHQSALRRGPHSERLYRGRMATYWRLGGGDNVRRAVYFLYNPSVLNFGYSLNPEIRNEVNSPQGGTGEGIAQQTFDFSVIFNRMYEVSYQNNKQGVRMDMQALEAMLEFTEDSPAIRHVPLKFYFGLNMIVEGVISSMNVQYQLFTQEMIPYHCEVSFQCFRVHSTNHDGFDRSAIVGASDERLNRITGVPNAPSGFLDRLGR